MIFSTDNKINWLTLSWFILTILLLVLSFNKYSQNHEQSASKHERRLISKIFTAKPININTGTENDFVKLKGVGIQRAKSIVAYRTKHGRFKRLSDIKQVPGLGESFFAENKELLALD